MALFDLVGTEGIVRIRGDREVIQMMEASPRVANQEMNAAFRVAGGIFYRLFNARLSGAGITVKRRVGRGKSGRGNIRVPAKARAMGFMARVSGMGNIQRKTLRMGTRNPAMVAHEFGAVIRARRTPFLRISIESRKEARATSQPTRQLPFFIQARQVILRPKLGFYMTWGMARAPILERLKRAAERIVRRASKRSAGGGDGGVS